MVRWHDYSLKKSAIATLALYRINRNRILTEFTPIILYENIAGYQGSNIPVADFLRSIGSRLFRYQPYLQKLIPADVNVDFVDSLNVIALPKSYL